MRKWVDLFLFYSTILIILSGIVLYIMPHGRVAYFTGWSFLGLNKDEWDNIHVMFGIIMVVFSIWHIVLNWKPLKKFIFKKESLIALAIVSIISLGTVKQIVPFKWVSDIEEYIKSLWPQNRYEIPYPHAELMSLKEFCKKTNIDLNKALNVLKELNIKATQNETLKEIAKKNNLTPVEIYYYIKNLQPKNNNFDVNKLMGSGIGRMSLDEFCKKYNVSLNDAINNLKQNKIKFQTDETLREIAFKNNLTPLDVAKIIIKGHE